MFPAVGAADVRVRRIFLKTAEAVCGKEEAAALRRCTARERARFAPEAGKAEWGSLAALYEKARYSGERMTREEVREAGKLSRRILHTIK